MIKACGKYVVTGLLVENGAVNNKYCVLVAKN
jgi:hypothetical protein